ncbi:MAG: hypothetical protein HY235_22065 [Acidobacteria bacterium]|nr:hypothetical protein [Acidobacteriota bacterium]
MRFPGLLQLGLCAAGLFAQQGQITGPVTGIVFDRASRSLRPILGVPGAAYFGEALAGNLDYAAVSPTGATALAVRDGAVRAITFQNGPRETPVAEGAAQSIAWSRTGEAAALLVSGRVLVWRPDQALAHLGFADGEVTGLAVDRGGWNVYVAVRGEQGGIFRFHETESPMLLARVADPGAPALSVDETTLIVADRASRQVLEIQPVRDGGAATRFAGGEGNPVAAAWSRDGRLVVVADADGKSILLYERSTRALLKRIECDSTPSLLEAIGDGGAFVMNMRGKRQALEVFSFLPEAAAYFVPAPEED